MLFLSPLLAMPQQHGGCVYPDAVLRALHMAGVPVDYAWLAWPLRGKRLIMRDPLRADYVRRGFVPETCLLGSWRVRMPITWSYRVQAKAPSGKFLPSLEAQSYFRRLVHDVDARAVLVDFATTLPVLDRLSASERARLRVGVLTHNLIHRRTELYRDRGIAPDFQPLTRSEEAGLLCRADMIVAIQDREAAAFRALVPNREVVVVPMPVEPLPSPPTKAAEKRCLFVGGYSGHNIDGLGWFLREVWPMVLAAIPDVQLDVVGTVGNAVRFGTPNVHICGSQVDLSRSYARATVCVVPLRFGTGLKIKLVEAMAHRRAVVTTPAGAEGFQELEAKQIVSVADTGNGMAEAILQLLREDGTRNAQIARQDAWVQNRLASSKAISPLLNLLGNGAERPSQ